MTLKYEVNHAPGVPQSTVAGFAPRGKSWHWTAGRTGRAGAESTIRHFQATRSTINASYHLPFWHEHRADGQCTTVAMEIVPLTKASHSMNPGAAFKPKSGSARERARFTEVHRILARDSDPNADCISLSFCGMPADLAVARTCAVFRADVRHLAALVARKASTVIDRPHFGHGWIQPTTRYETDATTGGADLFIAPVLYGQEDDMQLSDWRPVEEDWTTGSGSGVATSTAGAAKGEFWTVGPEQGESKYFNSPYSFHSFAESRDGTWRIGVAAGIAEILCVHRLNLRNPRNRRPAAPAYGYQAPPSVADLTAKAEDLAETVGRLSGRIRLKDEHVAKSHATYPKG